jgi:RimJ/RimL family protein N-acetyltransferase
VTNEHQDEPQPPSPETTLRYRGELVRLAAIEPEADAEVFAAWFDDPVSTRLAGFRPVRPMNRASAKERLEQWAKATPGTINFAARTIADDRLVGGIGIIDINHADGNAQLGLSIYRQDDWGHGYGREMIVLALRYAFNELNLHRVWLTTSAFNERALKLYEKLGFRHEGRGREHFLLDGRRWDIVSMGMLRDEFEG